jgi:beta-N-acetylhexosaminidase
VSPHGPISRRSFLSLAGGSAIVTTLAACRSSAQKPPPSPSATAIPATNTPAPTTTALPTATVVVPTPPPTPVPAGIDQKIGQMLMVGFVGPSVDANSSLGIAIGAGRLGNVVLFDADASSPSGVRNIDNMQQLAALCGELQALAPTPMLIATDEEGGKVARLNERHGFAPTVSEQYLGDQDDPALTQRYAGDMARELAAAGINLNLAPVVDVNVNPANPVIGSAGRSFSADPEVVTREALAFITAHHDQHVLCTLKHFPGHGSSTADSHLGFVDVTGTWTRAELEPFRAIIAAGQADVVMTAHIFNANLDPQYPATLSEPTIGGLLRREFGYDGVVLTDDMQMGASRQYYGFEEAIELAINAGADIIAIANTTAYDAEAHTRAFDAIANAVRAGRISEARIDESNRRIAALKQRLIQ